MWAESCPHVECDFGSSSLRRSCLQRSQTGRLRKRGASSAVGRVQARCEAAKVAWPRSPVLDRAKDDLDRSGKPLSDVAPPDGSSSQNPELSPDASRVALDRVVSGNRDVWVVELGRHITTRLTFDPAVDLGPVWSPNGDRIVFSSARKGVVNLYVKSSNGTGSEDLLLESPRPTAAMDWSRDGRFIIYRIVNPNGGRDLWVLPLFGDRKPYPFVSTTFNATYAQFSPDGRWVAYQSDESGQYEIYVQPFSGPAAKSQVSTTGGTHPRWNKNGEGTLLHCSRWEIDVRLRRDYGRCGRDHVRAL